MNPNFNRRQFIGLTVCVAVNTALPGCKKKEREGTAAKDDKLKPLAFEISEGKATPLSVSGWKRCDDYIHLHLSGSSIPDRKIAKVKQKKGTLIVYVDNGNKMCIRDRAVSAQMPVSSLSDSFPQPERCLWQTSSTAFSVSRSP